MPNTCHTSAEYFEKDKQEIDKNRKKTQGKKFKIITYQIFIYRANSFKWNKNKGSLEHFDTKAEQFLI